MQKKKNRLFLFLRLASVLWQTLQTSKLLLASKKVDLLSQMREEIHFLSRFLSVLFGLDKLFSRKFGMTHVGQLVTPEEEMQPSQLRWARGVLPKTLPRPTARLLPSFCVGQ